MHFRLAVVPEINYLSTLVADAFKHYALYQQTKLLQKRQTISALFSNYTRYMLPSTFTLKKRLLLKSSNKLCRWSF